MARRAYARFLPHPPGFDPSTGLVSRPGVIGPDDQPIWKPRWKVIADWPDLGLLRTSSVDLDTAAEPFEGLLAEEPTITRRLTDPLWPEVEASEASGAFWNGDGRLTAGYLADLVGHAIEIQRWDDVGPSYFQLSRLIGRFTWAALDDNLVRWRAHTIPVAALEDQIPKDTITTAEFPHAVPDVIGKTVPRLIGTATNVPLYCVCDQPDPEDLHDPPNGEFHYLVPPPAIGGIDTTTNALRRDGVGGQPFAEIPGPGDPEPEYEIRDDLYPGRRVIRTPKRQQRFGGNELHQLFGDFSAPEAGRNPVTAYGNVVEGTWALGEVADASSFDAAAAEIASIGGLLADGLIGRDGPVQAQEVLRELALFRQLRPGLTMAGAWTMTIDVPRTTIAVALADGAPDESLNVQVTEPRQRPAEPDRVRDLILRGGFRADGTHSLESRRTVNAGKGADRTIDCHFVGSPGTLDELVDYLAKVLQDDETVTVKGGQHLRSIVEGHLFALTYPLQAFDHVLFQVVGFTDDLIEVELNGRVYTLKRYTYQPGALPPDPFRVAPIDYSKSAPGNATAIAITDEGMHRNGAGQDDGYVRLSWVLPTRNCSAGVPLYREHVTSGPLKPWTALGPVPADQAQTAEIPGLSTTKPYDYGIRTVSLFGLTNDPALEGIDLITNHPALVDIVAPATPTGFTATAGIGLIRLKWDKPPESDYLDTEIFRNTADAFGDLTATFLARISGTEYEDTSVPLGTQEFYKIRHRDKSKNAAQDANNPTIALSITRSATATGGPQGTVPATPGAPTHDSTGVYQDAQGHWLAYEVVNVPAMPANAAYMNLLAKEHAAAQYSVYTKLTAGGGKARLEGGAAGGQYDIAFQAFNFAEQPSAVSTALTVTVGVDTTAPAIPMFALDGSQLFTVTVRVTSTPPADHKVYEYEIRTGSSAADGSGAGTLVKSGTFEGTLGITMIDIGYEVARHVRIRDKDRTGNPTTADGAGGKWTATQSFTFTKLGTVDLGNNIVTSDKRALLGSVSQVYSLSSGELAAYTLTHGLGFKPLISTDSGAVSVFANACTIGDSTFRLLLEERGGHGDASTAICYFY